MTKPTHHDVNYFAQRIESRHNTDLDDLTRCLYELTEIVEGIQKGLEVLKKVGKYPDQKVLANLDHFIELKEQFEQQIIKIKK